MLNHKVRSTGTQKGMLFSIAVFQEGAIQYADVHGIALVQLADGDTKCLTKSDGPRTPPPPWATIPTYVGWWSHDTNRSIMSPQIGEYTRKALGLPAQQPGAT